MGGRCIFGIFLKNKIIIMFSSFVCIIVSFKTHSVSIITALACCIVPLPCTSQKLPTKTKAAYKHFEKKKTQDKQQHKTTTATHKTRTNHDPVHLDLQRGANSTLRDGELTP